MMWAALVSFLTSSPLALLSFNVSLAHRCRNWRICLESIWWAVPQYNQRFGVTTDRWSIVGFVTWFVRSWLWCERLLINIIFHWTGWGVGCRVLYQPRPLISQSKCTKYLFALFLKNCFKRCIWSKYNKAPLELAHTDMYTLQYVAEKASRQVLVPHSLLLHAERKEPCTHSVRFARMFFCAGRVNLYPS